LGSGIHFDFATLLTPVALLPAALLLLAFVAWALLRRSPVATPASKHAGVLVGEEESTEVRDLRKTLYLLQNENKNLSIFLMTLPDLARQLNSSVEKRKIPELLMGCIQQLFDAQQILIFLSTSEGSHLTLAASHGLPNNPRGRQVVPFGRGRIGWVAHHQIVMDENDFTSKSRTSRGDLEDETHSLFRTELCAPMMSKDQTLGVISVGGLLRRPKNEKNMLKMVADLGSIALQNKTLLTRMQQSANFDGLTGIVNKRHFMDLLAQELLKAEKESTHLSLFMFDIDHFKAYNDTNGHLAGDEALKVTGRLLRETFRDDDVPARYGGEEFAVLLPSTDKNGAMIAAAKFRKAVEEFAYPNEEKSQPGGKVTISGGVATFPYDAGNTTDLIKCADKALYEGKHGGRNRVCAYEPRYLSDETGSIKLGLVDTQKI